MPRKKGQPYRREELKGKQNFALTESAKEGIKRIAQVFNLNQSELIESIGRGELFVSNYPVDRKSLFAPLEMVDLGLATGLLVEELYDIKDGRKKPSPTQAHKIAQYIDVPYELTWQALNTDPIS